MINLTIDGKKVTAEAGKTILHIAKENGIDIPALCYNKKVSKTTSCFVCVVKDANTGKFLPSCSAVPAEGSVIEASSPEVKDMRQTALNLLLSEHSGDCEAPCTVACPAHAAVEEYVRAGKEGKHLEALEIIKKRIPLPMSIGRVCPRFCEKDCRRNVTDKPVAINDFKRLAADLYYDEYLEKLPESKGKKVAIVGAGPAGLATAYYLKTECGIDSTIFERLSEGGGMLRYGIPEFRLPKGILRKELDHFDKLGVEIKYNQALGDNLQLADLEKDFDAVALTIGCWKASSMRVEGEELGDAGIEWLEAVASNNYKYDNPGKTIVVGGGNTAMDCTRTALRLGASEVICSYRRTEKEMPAEQLEIDEAREEGVDFHFLTAPTKLTKKGDKLVLTCLKMELGEPDASGRRRPVVIDGSEFDIEADTVISAIGQKTDAPAGIKTNQWGDVDVVEKTNHVERNIFAAGDCVTGAATVVEAVAQGRKIALSIQDKLCGDVEEVPEAINVSRGHWSHLAKDDLVFLSDPSKNTRTEPSYIGMDARKDSFEELFPTYTAEEIQEEGKRCFECSCGDKHDCKLKSYSETYGAKPDAIQGEKIMAGYDNRHSTIIHDRMKCIKCGVCIKTCSEVVNENLLNYKNRGYSSTVGTAFSKPLPESCSNCGECVEACPVGALEWKKKNDER